MIKDAIEEAEKNGLTDDCQAFLCTDASKESLTVLDFYGVTLTNGTNKETVEKHRMLLLTVDPVAFEKLVLKEKNVF